MDTSKVIVTNVSDVEFKFNQDFNGKLYVGIVVKIRVRVVNELDWHCIYIDGNSEDLSLKNLQELAT